MLLSVARFREVSSSSARQFQLAILNRSQRLSEEAVEAAAAWSRLASSRSQSAIKASTFAKRGLECRLAFFEVCGCLRVPTSERGMVSQSDADTISHTAGRTSSSKARVQIVGRVSGRRNWTVEQKLAIIGEAFAIQSIARCDHASSGDRGRNSLV
jgi:hypothetical protein